jgi:capsular polysaccharide biosynthesis protein
MTSLPLHDMPRWRTVASEQIRAVGLMTRKMGLALVALLVVLLVVVVQSSIRERDVDRQHIHFSMLEFVTVPWAPIGAIVAALFAIAMWRDEDPDRRSFHWMMPVDPRVHTLTKVMAGWVWVLAATAVSLASIATLGAVSSRITGLVLPDQIFGWSFWLVALSSVSVAYVLVSAAAVGTRQPIMWVIGVVLVYSGLLLALDALGYRDTHDVVRTALTGEYGFGAAVAGNIERLDTVHLRMIPSMSRWLGAFALWGVLGAILLVATSYRRAEPRVVGAHGPFRRAISGHAWLVTSVIALSVAAGVVATRVMKPEYEARATIWDDARSASNVRMAVADLRLTDMRDRVDVLRSLQIVDAVVRELALYVRPDNAADTSLLKHLRVGERFMPGNYRFAIDQQATRWQLNIESASISDSGSAGDSVGYLMGLRWRPDEPVLARYAGREVRFTVSTPLEAAAELRSRMMIVQPANSSFMQLSLTDPDPHRAANTLNAIASAYARTRDTTGAKKSVQEFAGAVVRRVARHRHCCRHWSRLRCECTRGTARRFAQPYCSSTRHVVILGTPATRVQRTLVLAFSTAV